MINDLTVLVKKISLLSDENYYGDFATVLTESCDSLKRTQPPFRGSSKPPVLPEVVDFSNYGSYDRLNNDGLTQWHLAFLALGITLDICAAAYRKFCKKYRPQPKSERRNHWGRKLLANFKPLKKSQKHSPGQKTLWQKWNEPIEAIQKVAEKFVLANCFDPKIASLLYVIPITQRNDLDASSEFLQTG